MNELVISQALWSEDSEALVKLRTEVFVDEQQVPSEIEVDGKDVDCQHVKAVLQGKFVGTGRLLPSGFIGRMCVLRQFRGQGIGTIMLHKLIELAGQEKYSQVQLNSQTNAIAFYRNNGFVIDSDEFLEAGIRHRRMTIKI